MRLMLIFRLREGYDLAIFLLQYPLIIHSEEVCSLLFRY